MMQKVLFDTLCVPIRKPKDSKITLGYSFERDGRMYYVDGKNKVCLSEHFGDTKQTVTDLVENTIRYESRKSS